MNLYGAEEFAHRGDCPGCQECDDDTPLCQSCDVPLAVADARLCDECAAEVDA